jgi:hypothetical protein
MTRANVLLGGFLAGLCAMAAGIPTAAFSNPTCGLSMFVGGALVVVGITLWFVFTSEDW